MIENKNLDQKYTVFSANVRYYRKKKKLTQEQLAESSDISTSYLKQIESGKEFKNITLTTMLKISKALNVELEHLFMIKQSSKRQSVGTSS